MLEEMLATLKNIENLLSTNCYLQPNQDITMLKVSDVAEILGININPANDLWKRDDFPGIKIGHKMIEKSAFYKWLQEKRI